MVLREAHQGKGWDGGATEGGDVGEKCADRRENNDDDSVRRGKEAEDEREQWRESRES